MTIQKMMKLEQPGYCSCNYLVKLWKVKHCQLEVRFVKYATVFHCHCFALYGTYMTEVGVSKLLLNQSLIQLISLNLLFKTVIIIDVCVIRKCFMYLF